MLVSNTSTLVLLAKVGCLETFVEVAPTIEVPMQVRREAIFGKESYDARLIEKLVAAGKIRPVAVDKAQVRKVMSQFSLHEGEAAAFVRFNSKVHAAILTDDGELMKLCRLEKVPFICAMAVILRLYERKLLSKQDTLQKLQDLSHIGRYSEHIYEHYKSGVK